MCIEENKRSKERDRRWQRVREFMRKRGLDALVVAGSRFHGEPLDRYLSDWIPGNFVIFPLESEPILLVSMIPEMLALRPDTPEEERPWIRDVRAGVRGAIIVAVLQEKGLERSRVGVVGLGGLRTTWEGWIPYRTWERVISKLPDCSFEDVTAGFAELISVRSSEELAQVRRAAQVLEQACEEMVRTTRAGVSELDIYAGVHRVLSHRGVYSPMMILRSGPGNASWGEPPWLFGVGTPRMLQQGDVVLAEIFASCGGLEAQVQMAVAIPPVSSVNSECAQLARLSYEEGLRHLQRGKKFNEVVAAMEAVLERRDVWYLTPLIHSMNPMLCISPTGVRIDSLPGREAYRQLGSGRIRGEEVVLEPGMVFELEPNACIGRHRVNIGGTVLVTEEGPEPLNNLPCQMRLAGEV
jgi:Xaa-Pro aminopeptidase